MNMKKHLTPMEEHINAFQTGIRLAVWVRIEQICYSENRNQRNDEIMHDTVVWFSNGLFLLTWESIKSLYWLLLLTPVLFKISAKHTATLMLLRDMSEVSLGKGLD